MLLACEWNAAPPASILTGHECTKESPNDPRYSPIDMGASIGDDRVWRLLEVRPQSDLVGHRSRSQEETSFLPGYLGDVCLEGSGGFVKVDIIAE